MSAREFPGDERYVVTAPLVMATRLSGSVVMLHDGDRVPADIDPAHRDHLLGSAMIALLSGAEPTPREASLSEPAPSAPYGLRDPTPSTRKTR